jgi:hypothetical protein
MHRKSVNITDCMGYQISKYSSEHFHGVVHLLDQTFGINAVDKASIIAWKYHSIHKDTSVIFVATDSSGNVVSHYANIPVAITWHEQVYSCSICVDMATDKRHRGNRLISQLAQFVYPEVITNGTAFSIGFSNEYGIQVDKHARNYGYTIVGKFSNYFTLSLIKRKTPYQLTPVQQIDQLSIDNDLPFFRIHKTKEYVSWRYIDKPNKDYFIYRISAANKSVGFVVLRVKNGKCYVHDIMVNDYTLTTLRTILQAIEITAIDLKTRLVVIPILENTYWRRVFFRTHYMKERTSKANRFLTVKIHNEAFQYKTELFDKDKWLLMNGDIL